MPTSISLRSRLLLGALALGLSAVGLPTPAPGGRMGGVLGEDAVEDSPPASSCVQDCQAQNRIRGSVPVPDPVYEGGDD